MPNRSPYIAKQIEAVRIRIPELLGNVRNAIEVGAGFPVQAGSVRVRRRELNAAITDACEDMTPRDADEMLAVLVREPRWLDTDVQMEEASGSQTTVLDHIRRDMKETMVSELSRDMYSAVLSQYEGATFASVIQEIREVIDASTSVGTAAQISLEMACSAQETKKLPSVRVLVRPMEVLRQALTVAGKGGDRPRLVPARKLMELEDLIDATGYRLDKTHVPSSPSPCP